MLLLRKLHSVHPTTAKMAKILQHILFVKLKPGVTDEQIKNLQEGLQLLTQIEGVISVKSGKNFTNRAPYDFGFVVLMKNKETLEHYSPHPIHVKVRDEIIAPLRESIIAVDFECDP